MFVFCTWSVFIMKKTLYATPERKWACEDVLLICLEFDCLVFALFPNARSVVRFSQPLARFSYMDGHFHATGYLDGHVHATRADATGRGLPEVSSKQRWPAWEMQRKHWLGDAADLHLVGCRGQMAAE